MKSKEEEQVCTRLQNELNEAALWDALVQFQGCPLQTVKGLEFTYSIKGGEIFVDRKEKSIIRSSVKIAFQKVIELEGIVTGPKKLKVFGASYLYPIFRELGIIK
ncbi:MAG: hypothetical protein PHE02_13240 [Lachnospiraceae bacterium]|nr:hypothetical protein [Lachnospiraceae bacterium]